MEYDGDVLEEQKEVEAEINKNSKRANRDKTLQIELDKKDILITYSNIEMVTVNFYEIDLEVLFSRTPFITK